MTSLFLKVALAGALTVASVLGLVGISGLIIFADVKAPQQPAELVEKQAPTASTGTQTFSGPNR